MLRIQNILFPTDFSDQSNHALPYAIQMAALYGAKLTVLHVITLFEHDPFDPEHTFPDITAYRTKIEEAAHAQAGHLVDRANRAPGEFEVERIVERGTAPYENILDVAQREAVDLIVLSTHGRSGLSHFLLGSVTEKIIRFARCPVLIVRKHEHEFIDPETGLIHLRNVLAPTDFSEAARKALQYAASIAQQFGAALHLAHVIEERLPPGFYATGIQSILEINPDIKVRVEEKLKEFARDVVPADVATHYIVLEGTAHGEIDRFARDKSIDLIVMGTEGYDEIGDYLIGSTTERTVRHAPCPVLVTH